MSKVIIFPNDVGGIAVMSPSPEWQGTMEELAAKDVPAGLPFKIIDASEIPADRTFRGAWVSDFDDSEDTITTCLERSRECWRKRIRRARVAAFEKLDREFMIALERGEPTEAIAAKKQALRDAPADPRIESAESLESLREVWIEELN